MPTDALSGVQVYFPVKINPVVFLTYTNNVRHLTTATSDTNFIKITKFPFHCFHDDVIKWKHFARNWPFVRGIHRSPVISPHKGQWRGALMFSLICAWINDWVNNREAGDSRHHRDHYDVIVMLSLHVMFAKQLLIQSNAVITRPNIVRYWINDCRNSGRISIRCWIRKRHHIPRPNGRDMVCILWIFLRKLTAL